MLVVAPSEGRRKLTVTGLRTPGSSPGYLKSGSSQRSGVVITVDVGPTLLDQFGIDFTDEMEGRPVRGRAVERVACSPRRPASSTTPSGSARRGVRLAPMTMLLVGLLGVLVLATLLVTAVGESVSVRRRRALAWCALFAMATLPSALLVQAVPGGIAGFGPYVLAVAGIAAALATGAWFLPRPYGPMLGMLGAMLGVVLLDAMTGSHLHFNAVFGYSPTANSRLYGISNYSYGVVLTSTILLATFIVVFVRSRYAFAGALALMGFVLVVEGLPAWGADVGGILASVPVFLLARGAAPATPGPSPHRRDRRRGDRGCDCDLRRYRSDAPERGTGPPRPVGRAGERKTASARSSRLSSASSSPHCASRPARSGHWRSRSGSRS